MGMSSAPSHQNEMAYAVHTSTCTYLLDDDGICRWIVSQQGMVPPHVRQCIGAQFVACLDVTVEGALVPELRVGARALFVGHDGERMIMLRTGAIQHVDDRRAECGEETKEQPIPVAAALRNPGHGQYGKPPAPMPGLPAPRPPPQRKGTERPPSFGTVRYHGEEQTFTFNKSTVRAPSTERIDPMDHEEPTRHDGRPVEGAEEEFGEFDLPTRRR